MTCNVGGIERGLRLFLAIIFALLAWFIVATGLKALFSMLAMVMLVTALVRFCPINSLIGRNSCSVSPRSSR